MENTTLEVGKDAINIATLLKMGPMAPVSNTHAIYAALRREQPVFETTNTVGGMPMKANRSFLITRYADVKNVLKDDRGFSNGINQRTMGIVTADRAAYRSPSMPCSRS